jgi:cell wall assembly regulator SMI1
MTQMQKPSLHNDIAKLIRAVPGPHKEGLPPGASDHALRRFETEVGISLPPGVRSWLTAYNGPLAGKDVFGIAPISDDLDMGAILLMYPTWRDELWLPVAGDGCGNYYLVATRNEFGEGEPVFFVDTMRDCDTPAYLVGSDVWHFMRFYLLDELDLTGWPFDAAEVVAADPHILNFKGIPLPWEA